MQVPIRKYEAMLTPPLEENNPYEGTGPFSSGNPLGARIRIHRLLSSSVVFGPESRASLTCESFGAMELRTKRTT